MTWGLVRERRLSLCLVALLILPVDGMASMNPGDLPPQASSTTQTSSSTPQTDSGSGSTVAGHGVAAPIAPSTDPVTAPGQANQTTTPAQSPRSTDQAPYPLGTAAAPEIRRDGVPGSAPAGAAIAPAKQRRVWRFSVKTALVVGAVVAVGVVAGVSLATSSRP